MTEIDVILQDYFLDNGDGKLSINEDHRDCSRKKLIAELSEVATHLKAGDESLASDYEAVIAYLERKSDEAFENEKAFIYGLCQD